MGRPAGADGVFALVFPARRAPRRQRCRRDRCVHRGVLDCCVSLRLPPAYPVVAVFGRVPTRRFARAALPPQAHCSSIHSSIASLPALDESGGTAAFELPSSVTGFCSARSRSWRPCRGPSERCSSATARPVARANWPRLRLPPGSSRSRCRACRAFIMSMLLFLVHRAAGRGHSESHRGGCAA